MPIPPCLEPQPPTPTPGSVAHVRWGHGHARLPTDDQFPGLPSAPDLVHLDGKLRPCTEHDSIATFHLHGDLAYAGPRHHVVGLVRAHG